MSAVVIVFVPICCRGILMQVVSKIKGLMVEQKDAVWIYAAVFFMSAYGGVLMVLVPFIVRILGGSDKDLGLTTALGFTTYFAGCIIGRGVLDRFNSKHLAQTGLSAITLCAISIYCILAVNSNRGGEVNLMPALNITIAFSGFFTSTFWPPIMGWLSVGHEGRELNRRLAFFNLSWSVGIFLSPYPTGLLAEDSCRAGMMFGIVILLTSITLLSFAPSPRHHLKGNGANVQINEASPLLGRIRLMARVGLVPVFICAGVLKTQLAMLFTENLGFTESNFGMAMTVMCLAHAVGFFAAGRTHAWHYKIWVFLFAQLVMIISMLLIIRSRTLPAFYILVGVAGLIQAFIYVSHQFYGVSASVKRSASMALHEILLSVGNVSGFLAGGYLAEYFNRGFAPYFFCACAIAAGLGVQVIIWRRKAAGNQ